MKIPKLASFFTLSLASFILFSCQKASVETPPDQTAASNVDLIARIVEIDSVDVSSNKDSSEQVFSYDAQNRLINVTENELNTHTMGIYAYNFSYNGADTMPSKMVENDAYVEFRSSYTYKNGKLSKDSMTEFNKVTNGVAVILVRRFYDTLGILGAYTKETQPAFSSVSLDTITVEDMTKDANSNIINWSEFYGKGTIYKIADCSYSNFIDPFFNYNRRNLWFYTNLSLTTELGEFIPLLRRDTKYLPTRLRGYKFGYPSNTLETDTKFEYTVDNTGRVNYIVRRYSTTSGYKEATKLRIYYK